MLLARAFDTKISSLYKAGKITGGVYLGRGHEAIAACGGVFLTAGYDVIAPFIREQAARVTWGEPIIEAARAYLGSALGYMKGRDGNVHRGLPAEGYMAPISHLGSTVAFVIGCLFAKRLDGKLPGPVGVAFCGDGTTSTGAFHEAANMANVERLPLVLVVTNNQFAYSTPNIREFGEASLADRGRGYGFTVHETDGTDFMATLETFRTAVNNAREGRGPQWVLAKTLRMCGHGEHDDASYIPRELKEEYEKKDNDNISCHSVSSYLDSVSCVCIRSPDKFFAFPSVIERPHAMHNDTGMGNKQYRRIYRDNSRLYKFNIFQSIVWR